MNNRCEKTANTITRHPNYRFFYQKPSLNPPTDSMNKIPEDQEHTNCRLFHQLQILPSFANPFLPLSPKKTFLPHPDSLR